MPAKNHEKRNEILRIVYQLCSETDYNSVSLSDIAKKANISKSLLQHYFAYKLDIMETLLRELLSSSAAFLETTTVQYLSPYYKTADYTFLFFRAACSDRKLNSFVEKTALYQQLINVWIDVVCSWLKEVYFNEPFSYLKLKTAVSFGMAGTLYLFSEKDNLGIDYDYIATQETNSVLRILGLDEEHIADIIRHARGTETKTGTASFLTYCEDNIPWFEITR